jgi:hypothetical protein
VGVDVVSLACAIGGTIGRAMEGNSVQHSCGLLPGARGAETAPPSIWSKPHLGGALRLTAGQRRWMGLGPAAVERGRLGRLRQSIGEFRNTDMMTRKYFLLNAGSE